MMGIVIQIFQEEFPDTYIDKTFFKNQLRIILTPAEGLLLNRINLEGYNAKFVILQRLEIEEEDQIKIEQFRPNIENLICEQEVQNQTFTNRLQVLKEKILTLRKIKKIIKKLKMMIDNNIIQNVDQFLTFKFMNKIFSLLHQR